jgi:hypothetical protein
VMIESVDELHVPETVGCLRNRFGETFVPAEAFADRQRRLLSERNHYSPEFDPKERPAGCPFLRNRSHVRKAGQSPPRCRQVHTRNSTLDAGFENS